MSCTKKDLESHIIARLWQETDDKSKERKGKKESRDKEYIRYYRQSSKEELNMKLDLGSAPQADHTKSGSRRIIIS